MRKLFFLIVCSFGILFAEECDYAFQGKYFIASYYGCSQEPLLDKEGLQRAMLIAAEASGAGVLKYVDYHFDGGGYTLTILLSESHASIHTYPEHNACFVDLFTCGERCSHEDFNEVLTNFLKPADAHIRSIERN
ncbi:MAG: adenosylmethionine decarboxylase [Simkaniaceae bacterium]|nr:MAG: adenosylmethionine decarboxylase [Simkaniaceae bacterium]